MIQSICIAGAGTMGAGIAIVAAQAGLTVILFDLSEQVLIRAATSIQQSIDQLVSRQKLTKDDGIAVYNRLTLTSEITQCRADFFMEAIAENLEAKKALLNQFAAINPSSVVFASNTSSLSISAIQAGVSFPERVGGMHFFNPATVMKLVEVVKGKQTSEVTAKTIFELCERLGKVPVYSADEPGFIVNRIARHYYLEAMKLHEAGMASIADMDALLEATGFKMGPFKLMDLIGLDINLTVSETMYKAFHQHPRFEPSALQRDKVATGKLGKKTGAGFYEYPA